MTERKWTAAELRKLLPQERDAVMEAAAILAEKEYRNNPELTAFEGRVMAPEELLTALRQRPFQPFQINLTDGRTLEVRHPEMVLPGRRSAVIGLPAPDDTEPLYDSRITVDLLHIVSLEPIQSPAKTNGQP